MTVAPGGAPRRRFALATAAVRRRARPGSGARSGGDPCSPGRPDPSTRQTRSSTGFTAERAPGHGSSAWGLRCCSRWSPATAARSLGRAGRHRCDLHVRLPTVAGAGSPVLPQSLALMHRSSRATRSSLRKFQIPPVVSVDTVSQAATSVIVGPIGPSSRVNGLFASPLRDYQQGTRPGANLAHPMGH